MTTSFESPSPVEIRGSYVGVVLWTESDHTSRSLARAAEYLGCRATTFLYNAPLPQGLDIVVARGPFGSLVPMAHQILNIPKRQRPAFWLVMSEQLPNPRIPEWFRYSAGALRTMGERMAYRQSDSGVWELSRQLRWITQIACRYRYYGDLYWLRREGALSVVSMSSKWMGEFLRARGFDPLVLPLTHHPEEWNIPNFERDIDVLWLGKMGSPRRRALLARIRAELHDQGVEMLVIDGIEHPYVFGKELACLLSRTKIALNLVRAWWDDNSLRYVLMAPKKVLIVSEPTLPHTDFVPGVHLVEATVDRLAGTIVYYLNHEEERRLIVERAYQLIMAGSAINNVKLGLERALASRGKEN